MAIRSRNEMEKEQRYNEIVDAAEKVFFEKGYENTAMSDIAKIVGSSRTLIYFYFQDKADVLRAVARRAVKVMADLMLQAIKEEDNGLDQAVACFRGYINFSQLHPNYFQVVMLSEVSKDVDDPEVRQYRNQIWHSMAQIIELGMKDGSIRSNIENPMLEAFNLWGTSYGLIHLMLSKRHLVEQQFNVSMDDAFESCVKFYINSLTSKTPELS